MSSEIIFVVHEAEEGGFCTRALGYSIFTQGDTWEELRTNVVEAVKGFYFDSKPPRRLRLHLVRDEVVLAT